MKKYISIVLLLSFVSLPLAQADTTVENDNTSGEVTYADQNGTDQLNPLRRLSYRRTEFSLYMSRPRSHIESEEDTVTAVIGEEQEEAGGCFLFTRPALACGIVAVMIIVTYVLLKRLGEALEGYDQ